MSVSELSFYVGRKCLWYARNGCWYECTIADVREVFNRVDFLIVPTCGGGKAWVSESTCTVAAGEGGAK